MLDNLHYEDYAPHRLSKFQLGAQGNAGKLSWWEWRKNRPRRTRSSLC